MCTYILLYLTWVTTCNQIGGEVACKAAVLRGSRRAGRAHKNMQYQCVWDNTIILREIQEFIINFLLGTLWFYASFWTFNLYILYIYIDVLKARQRRPRPDFFDRDGIFFLISPTAAVSTIPYVFYCAENGLFLDFFPFFPRRGGLLLNFNSFSFISFRKPLKGKTVPVAERINETKRLKKDNNKNRNRHGEPLAVVKHARHIHNIYIYTCVYVCVNFLKTFEGLTTSKTCLYE